MLHMLFRCNQRNEKRTQKVASTRLANNVFRLPKCLLRLPSCTGIMSEMFGLLWFSCILLLLLLSIHTQIWSLRPYSRLKFSLNYSYGLVLSLSSTSNEEPPRTKRTDSSSNTPSRCEWNTHTHTVKITESIIKGAWNWIISLLSLVYLIYSIFCHGEFHSNVNHSASYVEMSCKFFSYCIWGLMM